MLTGSFNTSQILSTHVLNQTQRSTVAPIEGATPNSSNNQVLTTMLNATTRNLDTMQGTGNE